MARELNLKEGILSGGSSGAILAGALKSAKSLKKGQNCVIILPDGIRNYLTKFLTDDWMVKKHFLENPEKKEQIFPKNTFEIKEVYNPELPPTDRYQLVETGWTTPTFNPRRPMLMNTMDEAIGWTPLVRLNKIPKEENVEAEICMSKIYFNLYFFSGQVRILECGRLDQR
jgi:hypothetical protein